MRILMLALVAVLALGIGACTPQEPDVTEEEQVGAAQRPEEPAEGEAEDGGNGEAGGETFTFVAVDIDWGDHPSELPAGDVTLELDNQGGIFHDLVIEELGNEVVAEAEGGETDSGTVTLEPGEYTIFCDVPGHRQAGMETTVTVS
ncbi:MAG TPA: plastocyanin/azurin family copper-binding protein [Egibacteraceae bacterium]|nr:plastocyanin/azurin family copper-binding protein [Egibacteraceae bacterium]